MYKKNNQVSAQTENVATKYGIILVKVKEMIRDLLNNVVKSYALYDDYFINAIDADNLEDIKVVLRRGSTKGNGCVEVFTIFDKLSLLETIAGEEKGLVGTIVPLIYKEICRDTIELQEKSETELLIASEQEKANQIVAEICGEYGMEKDAQVWYDEEDGMWHFHNLDGDAGMRCTDGLWWLVNVDSGNVREMEGWIDIYDEIAEALNDLSI